MRTALFVLIALVITAVGVSTPVFANDIVTPEPPAGEPSESFVFVDITALEELFQPNYLTPLEYLLVLWWELQEYWCKLRVVATYEWPEHGC
jgi:hypothetical protein